MMQFGMKKKVAAEADGKTFLAKAKADHQALFATFTENADAYDSVDEYTDAACSEAWEMAELIAKQSYKNGIKRGKATSKP